MLQAPLAAAATPCCSAPDSHQVGVSDGCCAEMPCCVISDGSAAKSITPAPVANEVATFLAPVAFVSLIEFPANPVGIRFAKVPPVAHSPPPRALLCTYLI